MNVKEFSTTIKLTAGALTNIKRKQHETSGTELFERISRPKNTYCKVREPGIVMLFQKKKYFMALVRTRKKPVKRNRKLFGSKTAVMASLG